MLLLQKGGFWYLLDHCRRDLLICYFVPVKKSACEILPPYFSPSWQLHGHCLLLCSLPIFICSGHASSECRGCVKRWRRNLQVRKSEVLVVGKEGPGCCPRTPLVRPEGRRKSQKTTCSCVICATRIAKSRPTSQKIRWKLALSRGKKYLANHSEAFQTIFLFILKTALFPSNISHQTKHLKFLRSTVTFCFVNKRLTYSTVAFFEICFLIQWKSDDKCCHAEINSFSITVRALEWFIPCKVFGKNEIYLTCSNNKGKLLN